MLSLRYVDVFLLLCSDVLPYLQMRRAREEDHDDLCPVIERAQKRGLPLTDIPLSAVPSKAYSVARFIRAQTEQNNVFVAEVCSSARKAI